MAVASNQDLRIRDVIELAQALIETKGWTQNAYARTARGHIIGTHTDNAACFCTVGALKRAAHVGALTHNLDGEEEFRLLEEAANYVRDAARVFDLVIWNDDPERTKDEVVAAFDKAKKAIRV